VRLFVKINNERRNAALLASPPGWRILMKALKARLALIDCGAVSKRTRGQFTGFFSEAGQPPFVWWD